MASLADLTPFLPPGTLDAWPKVASVLPEGSALMGGTGLAVLLHHRLSEDLDFFVPDRLDVAHITAALSQIGEFTYSAASDRMIRGTFDATNVDIVARPDDFWLGPPRTIDGLNIGSLQDITAGKYNAIATRKQLRDFVDVMWIETHGSISIEQGIFLYFRKHGIDLDMDAVRGFLRHLTDFRYLDEDPAMSATFGDDIHQRVTAFFQGRSPAIIATFSQLLTDDPPAHRATSKPADPPPSAAPTINGPDP